MKLRGSLVLAAAVALEIAIVAGGASQVVAQPAGSIPVWRDGRVAGETTRARAATERLIVVDVGDGWVPRLFAGGPDARGAAQPSTYARTFAALAREDYSADPFGRAARDRYLEPYGIPPAVSVLRTRLARALERTCGSSSGDRATLQSFGGLDVAEGRLWEREPAAVPERFLQSLLSRHDAFAPSTVPLADLTPRDRRLLRLHARWSAAADAIVAVQRRLACDGHLRGSRFVPGAFDAPTRNALAELERRHRIYALGRLTGETLAALRTSSAELERRAVVRVLTERAMSAAGLIEDASATVTPDGFRRDYFDGEGNGHPMRDLESEIAARIVASFGLETPESTARWLASLGELPSDGHAEIAFEAPELPPYYGSSMDLYVVIDRGDVWYDPPFDESGRLLRLPMERWPTLSLYVRWLGQDILLARYPTTIGGWRIERSAQGERWRYYESPMGSAAWDRIVAAPVWLPPASTPPADLVTQYRVDDDGEPVREVRAYLLGPGYASAYGLVAAYHRPATRQPDGSLVLGPDEGIRTHGSVDYTSIWQRASHGCHRLHNHLAVRLFDFVLARRPHRRLGESALDARFRVSVEGLDTELRVTRTGYTFELERPLPVEVLRGSVRGALQQASQQAVTRVEPSAESPAPGR